MKALVFFFFILSGLGSAEVRVNQSRNKDQYTEGDSAEFQCKITFETEVVENCLLEWAIENPYDKKKVIEFHKLPKFKGRYFISSNLTHSSMILERLTTSDTDTVLCYASCTVNQHFDIIFGNKLSLKVKAQSRTWLHYLIFGINLLVFIVATIFCVIIIRKRNRRRNCTDD